MSVCRVRWVFVLVDRMHGGGPFRVEAPHGNARHWWYCWLWRGCRVAVARWKHLEVSRHSRAVPMYLVRAVRESAVVVSMVVCDIWACAPQVRCPDEKVCVGCAVKLKATRFHLTD